MEKEKANANKGTAIYMVCGKDKKIARNKAICFLNGLDATLL
ncbi:MAG: hypothetical protein PF542_06705 [Nanoarchaeota archaeon]|jgi:hypothetical protein|nr:hypothetical protein [Nanoarchaeota archaeon]